MNHEHDIVAALIAERPDEIGRVRGLVETSLHKNDPTLVELAEREVMADPTTAIRFDAAGTATVATAGRRFCGGRFALRSMGDLRAALPERRPDARHVRLYAVQGPPDLTDIGALQAFAGPGTLFQVASQFNCLEAPSPGIVPVSAYMSDNTQGPRAALSAFPGALVRHYAAPVGDGTRFVQSRGQQLDLLAEALPVAAGQVRGGYLTREHLADAERAAAALTEHFDRIRVGVHDNIDVVLGADRLGAVAPGQQIAQVLTSTYAANYSRPPLIAGPIETICRQLLRAAYLGTILSALSLAKRQVVLTMIGGGVFGNPHRLIWECICWAVDEADMRAPHDLTVVLNAWGTDAASPEDCANRGGKVVELGGRLEVGTTR